MTVFWSPYAAPQGRSSVRPLWKARESQDTFLQAFGSVTLAPQCITGPSTDAASLWLATRCESFVTPGVHKLKPSIQKSSIKLNLGPLDSNLYGYIRTLTIHRHRQTKALRGRTTSASDLSVKYEWQTRSCTICAARSTAHWYLRKCKCKTPIAICIQAGKHPPLNYSDATRNAFFTFFFA